MFDCPATWIRTFNRLDRESPVRYHIEQGSLGNTEIFRELSEGKSFHVSEYNLPTITCQCLKLPKNRFDSVYKT
jgi:hypothetical protein